MADYIACLHKDKDSDYGVSFPDFPGAITAGKTLEEARQLAVEALQLHIAGMIEDGEEIPAPSTLDSLADDPDMKGAIAFLVPVQPSPKTVRFNVTARENQLAEIDAFAEEAGMTRSAYIVQSALARRPVRIVDVTRAPQRPRKVTKISPGPTDGETISLAAVAAKKA